MQKICTFGLARIIGNVQKSCMADETGTRPEERIDPAKLRICGDPQAWREALLEDMRAGRYADEKRRRGQ